MKTTALITCFFILAFAELNSAKAQIVVNPPSISVGVGAPGYAYPNPVCPYAGYYHPCNGPRYYGGYRGAYYGHGGGFDHGYHGRR